jgi:hypothetical protein
MDLYLNKYKGKYRVKAHYDLSTNDFIRDSEGNLDNDFADFYLSGRSGIEIKHGYGSELACYIPKLTLGNNILKSYYDATIADHGKKSVEHISKELIDKGFATEVDIMDCEVMFTFNAKYLDTLAPIVKLKTAGSTISPFSTRNLPKAPYNIPKKDMDKYKKAKGELTGLQIGRLQDEFIKKRLDKNFKSEMKKEMLKATQYIHKIGKWDEYCEYIKESAK